MAEEAIFEDVEGTFIGIDLGTSNSVVSYFKNNQFEQIKFKNRKMIPSVLFFESKDKILFGDRAIKKGVSNPEFLIKEFKRDLGSKTKYTITFPREEKSKQENIFVIDTNIFIDEPLILKQFSNEDEIKVSKTVISEITHLGTKDELKDAADMALESIEEFKSEENISFEESNLDLVSEDLTVNSANDDNDNRILSIAKYFKENQSEKTILLITNDKGLTLKAESEGIGVLKYDDFNSFKSQEENTNISEEITISPKEASKLLLAHIKEESEKYLGEIIEKALITVPANFNPSQISLVKEAGEEAGFSEIAIQKEPVAVGFAYALEESDDKTILIYDFGGGTFDVSFLKVSDGNIEVIETDGDNKLGGKDITQKVVEIIFDKILDENDDLDMFDKADSGLSLEDYNSNLSLIEREAEKVKIELSDYDKAEVAIANLIKNDGNSINIQFELSKKEFETEINEIRKKAIDIVKSLINSAGVELSDIDDIIMAGGSSSIPSLRDSLKDQLGKEPKKTIDTSIVISQGAVVESMRKWSDAHSIQNKIIYNDNALHDFGIGIKDFNFDMIIPKGTALPVSITKDYTTEKDNQDTIEIKVFQRKSTHETAKKTHDKGIDFVDELIISGIPPSIVNELTIRVTFELTKDDSLEVDVNILDSNDNIQHSETINISKSSNV